VTGTLGTITRTDGTSHVTYDGTPHYTFYFARDKSPGDVTDQGPGKVWLATAPRRPASPL
jgi:predicted lipoprotein with Yx(FWY)xxD motif